MLVSALMMSPDRLDQVYGPEALERVRALGPLTVLTPGESLRSVPGCQVLLSGWGAPLIDGSFLEDAPDLRLLLYAAGSMKTMLTPSVWARGIRVCSARHANAVPVAEYTLSVILLSLKHFWQLRDQVRQERSYPSPASIPGAYRSKVGLISLGAVGRRVLELMRPFDLQVHVCDPFTQDTEIRALGAVPASLELIFEECEVVSLHTPWLPETEGMVGREHFAAMRPGATFLNTARGAVVREGELIEVLTNRPDLTAILDVTYPEPPLPDSPLFDLPNVVLTPHIAGAVNGECRRLGEAMVTELERWASGIPLQYEVTEAIERTLA